MHQSTQSGSLPPTVCLNRISCEQLGLGHSYLSNVLGQIPKKTILLMEWGEYIQSNTIKPTPEGSHREIVPAITVYFFIGLSV